MSQMTEMERLEQIVAGLLDKYNTLLAEKNRLADLLAQREATIESLEGDLAAMSDERGEISTRVNGLLGRIEAWESGVDELAADQASPDEGGVQGNLFSVNAQEGAAAE